VTAESLGEPNVKRALTWVLRQLEERPTAKRSPLIDEASRRFDLTPLEAEFLYRQLVEAARPPGNRPADPA
jgi:hypothetical protein